MLRALVDASASKDESIVAIAGFVAKVDDWSKAQRAWREVRKRSDIEYFHMTDFMSRRAKPYNTWTEKKRRAVIHRLADVINTHMAFGVVVAVDIPNFNAARESRNGN
jgi:hypothetical protein